MQEEDQTIKTEPNGERLATATLRQVRMAERSDAGLPQRSRGRHLPLAHHRHRAGGVPQQGKWEPDSAERDAS